MATSSGWASVTMGGLAEQVGVSRQTVYNEVGSKPQLAEAMVLHELAAFLALVDAAFDRHPQDPVAAIGEATSDVLAFARRNALLRAIVTADQGAETELLPLLTSRSTSVVDVATDVIAARLQPFLTHVDAARRPAVVDTIVRVVLSHVTASSDRDRDVAVDVAWVAGRLMGDPGMRG